MNSSETKVDRAGHLLRAAYQKQMAGDLQSAIQLYKASIEAHPTAEAHTFLGWTYSSLGHYDLAIAECKTAIQVDPEFGNPYNDIGSYLVHLGQLDEAIPWLQRAKEAKRYEPRHFPYMNLGRVYLKLGRLQDATREFEQAAFLQKSMEDVETIDEDPDATVH